LEFLIISFFSGPFDPISAPFPGQKTGSQGPWLPGLSGSQWSQVKLLDSDFLEHHVLELQQLWQVDGKRNHWDTNSAKKKAGIMFLIMVSHCGIP